MGYCASSRSIRPKAKRTGLLTVKGSFSAGSDTVGSVVPWMGEPVVVSVGRGTGRLGAVVLSLVSGGAVDSSVTEGAGAVVSSGWVVAVEGTGAEIPEFSSPAVDSRGSQPMPTI